MRGADLSSKSLVAYCEQGDKLAKQVCDSAGQMLGIALADYASLIDPEAIILTGELTSMGEWLMTPLMESFNAHVFRNLEGQVKVFVSIIKDDERDVLGASALAWEVKEYSLFK